MCLQLPTDFQWKVYLLSKEAMGSNCQFSRNYRFYTKSQFFFASKSGFHCCHANLFKKFCVPLSSVFAFSFPDSIVLKNVKKSTSRHFFRWVLFFKRNIKIIFLHATYFKNVKIHIKWILWSFFYYIHFMQKFVLCDLPWIKKFV